MNKLIIAAALAGSCALANAEYSANNGRVAFLKAIEPSQQEQAALNFFQQQNPGATVFTTDNLDDLNAEDYDCLWIHIDRKGLNQGYDNLPEVFRNAKVKSFWQSGGNLYLSGHATQIATGIGRNPYNVTVYGNGEGGVNNDPWTVSTSIAGADRSEHAIYAGIEDAGENRGYVTFGLLSTTAVREDHNCLWNLENYDYQNAKGDNRARKFENKTNSMILGAWGQNNQDKEVGVIEFYPVHSEDGDVTGTIIANGLAACQWHVDGENLYADNIKAIAANALAYLAGEEKPFDPWVEPEKPEVPELGANVAFWMPFNESEATEQELGAKNLFASITGDKGTILTGVQDIDLADYACVWLHIEKDNIQAGWRSLPNAEEVAATLKAYLSEGGNIYLSKQAVMLVNGIERTNDEPTEWNNLANTNVSNRPDAGNDNWKTNIAANGADWSTHAIFNGMETEQAGYGTLLTLLGAGTAHYDRNIMWKLNELGGHDNFCSAHNARVLGTWGHDGGQSFAGIVEFLPTSSQMRAISKDKADARKGTVIANGLAAYHITPLNGTSNPAQQNINTLTANTLAYLAPAVSDEGSTTYIAETEYLTKAPARWFTLQGVEVANPSNGLFIKVQGDKAVKVIR